MKPQDVDEYIAASPAEAHEAAAELRAIIKKAAPEAQEKLSYGMPYYSYNGRLVYWGAYKDRLSLYVMSAAREALSDEIEPYRAAKSTLHLALDEPLPTALIAKIVATQLAFNKAKK